MPKYSRFVIAAAIGLTLHFLVIGTAYGRQHVVGAGESLSLIADMYEVTVGQLVDLNGIADPNLIFPGQTIDVPGGDASTSTYEVQSGDTLSGIAAKFGITTLELQLANEITDADYIYPGQTLQVPSGGASPAPAPGPSLADKPVDPELEGLFEEFASHEGIDPGLVKALAWVESGWQQHVVSPTGAAGIMQIMPGTAAWLETDVYGYELNERESAYDNIKMGTAYLSILLRATSWNEKVAVGSYYQGHGNTLNGILYNDTVDYIAAVFAVRDAYWP
jgi:LysM repeat protein